MDPAQVSITTRYHGYAYYARASGWNIVSSCTSSAREAVQSTAKKLAKQAGWIGVKIHQVTDYLWIATQTSSPQS